jgi:hypothetical protein
MPRSADNLAVVKLLEEYTEIARENGFSSVAIALVCHSQQNGGALGACDFAGDISLQKGTLDAVGELQFKLQQSIANYALPEKYDHLDASYVCYDACRGPLGFDFLNWIIDVEMTRKREGAPGPLKVGFWLGNNPEVGGDALVIARRRHWLSHVFRPLLQMVGAVEDAAAIHGRTKEVYVSRDICAAARMGEAVPRLRPPDVEMPGGAVTITLRESSYWTHRNSNLAAWIQFAIDLKRAGERVIFIRDTEKADEALEGWETCPIASTNLLARTALYENSKANLFVSNGPATLALYGRRPWLQFTPVEKDGAAFYGNTPKFWKDSMGVEVGSQYPWSANDQRIVWLYEQETYETLKWAYETWMTNRSN